MTDESDIVIVYTDGSAAVKDKSGGWAFVAKFQGRQVHRFGSLQPTTINAMELMAIQKTLEFIALSEHPLRIITDSQYSQMAVTKWYVKWKAWGWETATGEPIKNAEIVRDILDLLAIHRRHRVVTIEWTPGHTGNPGNEFADKLAHEARVNKSTNWT